MEPMDVSLCTFLTRDGSLESWRDSGLLGRELQLSLRLAERLRGVTLVSGGGREDARIASEFPSLRVIANRGNLPQRWYRRSLYARFLLRSRRRTVLRSNQVLGADVPLRIAQLLGMPFVARCGYLHSDFTEKRFGVESKAAREAREFEGCIHRQADAVVVTAEWMRERVLSDYSLAPERVAVIPNYVDTEEFHPRVRGEDDGRTICFVGRFVEQKNLFALFDAVAGLEVRLRLVGDGPHRESLVERAGQLGIEVEFLGRLPHAELPAFLGTASVFVLPSLYEGHPKAMLEAMAAGVPVLGGDSPGIREQVEHGRSGALCGTTAREIREGLRELLGSPALRDRLGRGGREYILAHCSLDRVVDLELDLLARVRRR